MTSATVPNPDPPVAGPINRHIQILLVLAVVQLVVVAWLFWPRPGPNTASGPLFPNLTAGEVTDLTLQDGSETLHMQRQGEGWILPEMASYPVTQATVDSLLAKIVALQNDRLIANTSASHKRLKVADDDFVGRLNFQAQDGKHYTLFIGSSPNARATHIRVDGQDAVYLSGDLSSGDVRTSLANWVNTAYVSLVSSDVQSMTLENGNGRLEFTKTDGAWTMAGLTPDQSLNTSLLETTISRLSGLRFLKPLGKELQAEYGLDKPAAVLTLVTQKEGEEARAHTLMVGSQDTQDQSFVVKSSDSDYFVRVAGFNVQNLTTAGEGDFILPPTPEAEPTATTTP